MSRFLKYGLLAVVTGLLAYNSVYIKKLSEVKALKGEQFDAVAYAKELWKNKLPAKLDSAVDITVLKSAITADAEAAFNKYTHALTIGNYRYALVKGSAIVDSVTEDAVIITVQSPQPFKAVLLTELIYGNTLRDASGLLDLQSFPNTNDLNNISEALNRTIREKVIPAVKPLLKPGSKIGFTGAIELNKEHVHFDDIELVPVRIKMVS